MGSRGGNDAIDLANEKTRLASSLTLDGFQKSPQKGQGDR